MWNVLLQYFTPYIMYGSTKRTKNRRRRDSELVTKAVVYNMFKTNALPAWVEKGTAVKWTTLLYGGVFNSVGNMYVFVIKLQINDKTSRSLIFIIFKWSFNHYMYPEHQQNILLAIHFVPRITRRSGFVIRHKRWKFLRIHEYVQKFVQPLRDQK